MTTSHTGSDEPLLESHDDEQGRYAFFHMIARLIPRAQVVVAVPPSTSASAALDLMRQKGFSQLPVQEGGRVLGVFSYRSFALEAAGLESFPGEESTRREKLAELPVDEFLELEGQTYASETDGFDRLIDVLDRNDCVMVSGPEALVALVTPMDALHYLYSVAKAFLLLEEIERAIRSLIRIATPRHDDLRSCIDNALSKGYSGRTPPGSLEDMTFNDYVAVIRDGRNWTHYEPVFGPCRERISRRLEEVRKLRNDVVHFRRELTLADHRMLARCRLWLSLRVQSRGSRPPEVAS